mmetsp:Transcript_10895/g.16604  ORF Transcript_10895/g.16604 Transcript_10895/m.16604 type:complete len:233 (+) Transcript_10895:73-771(+)
MGCGSSTEAPTGSTATRSAPNSIEVAQQKQEPDTGVPPPDRKPSSAIKTSDSTDMNWKQIHSAIRWNKPTEEVRAMLTKELANSKDTGNGNFPLHIASQNGHLNLVELLIECGADINCQNFKGNTPLHMALSYDYIDVAEFLISAGVDMDLKNESDIPARKGLEGDKCLAAVYLAAAKNTDDAVKALQKCLKSIEDLDKATFAATGLRVKKSIGGEWTDEVNTLFKEVLGKI